MMNRSWLLCAFLIATPLMTTKAHAQCRLCAPVAGNQPTAPTTPLSIAVEATLDLGRAAHLQRSGGGTISIDPVTGARTVTGALADLGGMSLKGTVRLTGTPFSAVSISLPASIQLTAPDGSTANIVDIRSTASSNPMLDAQGVLTIGFGGRLVVTNGSAGDFRGRIPVVAEYR